MKGTFKISFVAAVVLALCSSTVVGAQQQCSDQPYFTRLTVSTSFAPTSVATADFDRDGKLDLVAVGDQTGTTVPNWEVYSFRGNGRGQFASIGSFSAVAPHAVAAGDFNRDARPDVVVASPGPGQAGTLLGAGDGTFGGFLQFTPGYDAGQLAPGTPAISDLNRDGLPDVAFPIGTNNTLGLGFGDGAGTFWLSVLPVTLQPVALVAEDFNRDGIPDLVTTRADWPTNYVEVWIGSGWGWYYPGGSFDSGGLAPVAIVPGDFNRDGVIDLAIAHQGIPEAGIERNVSVLLGNGWGGFDLSSVVAGVGPSALDGGHTSAMVASDFNRDGKLDLAVAEFDRGRVAVLSGDGDGQVAVSKVLNVASPYSLHAADVNTDGRPDLIVADHGSPAFAVHLNACQ